MVPNIASCLCCVCVRSDERPTTVIQTQLQAAVLQRTHALMVQYIPLPLTWEQVWQQADAQQPSEDDILNSGSITATATVAGLLRMLDTAAYDAEAQILLPASVPSVAGSASAGCSELDGVLAQVEAIVQPLHAFFGRQHLAALNAFTGPVGVQQLVAGVLDKLEQEQVRTQIFAGLEVGMPVVYSDHMATPCCAAFG